VAAIPSEPLVDVIIAVDNGYHMADEVAAFEEQLNQSFAVIVDAASPPLDYRVVLVSKFGVTAGPLDDDVEGICIADPLGGLPDADFDGHCDEPLPAVPGSTARFFHYDTPIDEADPWCALLDAFATADPHGLMPNGYQDVIRPGASKLLLVVSNDRSLCTGGHPSSPAEAVNKALAFDAKLLALSAAQFGSAQSRKYSSWGIIGQEPYLPSGPDDPGVLIPPSVPIDPDACAIPGGDWAVWSGMSYQALSILTGGHRLPTCGLDYSPLLEALAQEVIDKGTADPCAYEIPVAPPGEVIDLSTLQMQYDSSNAPVATFGPVPAATDCDGGSFYVEGGRIHLCPDACATVGADPLAELSVVHDCPEPEVDEVDEKASPGKP
jgi:hypothetical protein